MRLRSDMALNKPHSALRHVLSWHFPVHVPDAAALVPNVQASEKMGFWQEVDPTRGSGLNLVR